MLPHANARLTLIQIPAVGDYDDTASSAPGIRWAGDVDAYFSTSTRRAQTGNASDDLAVDSLVVDTTDAHAIPGDVVTFTMDGVEYERVVAGAVVRPAAAGLRSTSKITLATT